MQLPQLRTPFTRAVVPVAAGIGFIAVLGLIMWGVAAWLSGDGTRVTLGDTRFEIGRVDRLADSIAQHGPQLYADLKDSSGKRAVVVDHTGTTDAKGWAVYRPVPASDPTGTCLAAQVHDSRRFTDCNGNDVDVTALQPAPDVRVIIEDGTVLALEFAEAVDTGS